MTPDANNWCETLPADAEAGMTHHQLTGTSAHRSRRCRRLQPSPVDERPALLHLILGCSEGGVTLRHLLLS